MSAPSSVASARLHNGYGHIDRAAARQDKRGLARLNGKVAQVALATAFCIAPLAGQRAACTGTVRDGDGHALAEARVTFWQEASQTLGDPCDRVDVRTAADGSFSAGLLLGSPYVVWAISKPDVRRLGEAKAETVVR